MDHVDANGKQQNVKFPPLCLSNRKVKNLNTFIVGFCCRHPNFDLRSQFPVFVFGERGSNLFQPIIALKRS